MSAILISKNPEQNPHANEFENRLLSLLAERTSSGIIVSPHIYYITKPEKLSSEIENSGSKVVVCAWLRKRATQNVLRYFGVPESVEIIPLDFAEYADPEACADEILSLIEDETGESRRVEISPDSASETRWYPIIDKTRCNNCGQCREFCIFGVYNSAAETEVRVVNPDKCKPGCPACSRICPQGAIIFPHCRTDEGVAGKPGVEIQHTNIDDARSFAKNHIKKYSTPQNLHQNGSGSAIDSLIEELEERENGLE